MKLQKTVIAISIALCAGPLGAVEPAGILAQSKNTPQPPWLPGDQWGMANTLGTATWKRCAPYLANPKAKSYELSHLRQHHAAVAVRHAARG